MKRFHLSKLTFLLATLLALALMTAQMASAASLEDEWSIVKSPNGSLPQNTLNGIVAISQDDVWAVGDGQCLSDSCSKTLIEHWNGSRWSIVKSPNPGFTQSLLNGAVVISKHNVWAVGSFDSNGGSKVNTMVLHWDGSRWSVVKSPNPGTFNFLYNVKAVSANDIWAVGNYYTGSGSPSRTLVEHWNGSRWSVVKSPNVGMHDNFLANVTTVSAKDAWVVGGANDRNNISQSLIEHWDGTNWSVVKSPDFGPNGGFVGGVVSVSASDIWAVGGYNINQSLIEHWNGTNWSVVKNPNSGTADFLAGVVALSASNIWAVGAYNSNENVSQTLIEHWNGSQWSTVKSPNRGSGDFFNAVAAVSAHDVWAGGAYFTTSHPNQTLIEHCC